MNIFKYAAAFFVVAFLTSCGAHKPTTQSTNSFNKAFGSIDWKGSKAGGLSISGTCAPALIKMAESVRPKNVALNKNVFKKLMEQLISLDEDFNKIIKKYDLESKLSEDNGLFKIGARDKLYNAFKPSGNLKDFVRKVKRRSDKKPIDWKGKENAFDKELKRLHQKINLGVSLSSKNITIGKCKAVIEQEILITEVLQTKIVFNAGYKFYVLKCPCTNGKPADVKLGAIRFDDTVEASFLNDKFDLNAAIFKHKNNVEHHIFSLFCCGEE